MAKKIDDTLFEEILRARTRVYRVGAPTPIQDIQSPSDYDVFIKREDLGPINAYKWRGAYNAVYVHHEKTGCKTVVAASAGNHAQGVALAARERGIKAKIFMPLSTPLMKQTSVQRHGGENVEIVLTGDTYNDAAQAAHEYVQKHKGVVYIHPFDDIYTIAGQATIADEIMLSPEGPFDVAFVQIGGGGMAAAVSAWLKLHNPDIKIIGVEGVDQASMTASIAAGKPVTLTTVDTFCDGTAVTRPGDLTFDICRRYIDAFITVTNEEVSAAIAQMWNARRVIPEPSGAMGLAGLVQYAQQHPKAVKGKRLLAILCGANMDFGKISSIAQKSAIGGHGRRYLQFHIDEKSGGLLNLLDTYFKDINVSEFLYGKISERDAWPVIGLESTAQRMDTLEKELKKQKVAFDDVTLDPDVRYRIINYNPALFKHPVLMHVHFPERKGALREFMRKISGVANVCYFNYAYSGEAIGRTLMGFEFKDVKDQKTFFKLIEDTPATCRPVDDPAAARILKH